MLNRVRQVELHSNFQKYFSCQPAQFSLHQKIEIFLRQSLTIMNLQRGDCEQNDSTVYL